MVHSDRNLTCHFYETVCQRLPLTSHFIEQSDREPRGHATSVYLKMSLPSFLVWRFKLETLALEHPGPYGSQHSTTYHPSLDMLRGRILVLLLLSDYSRQYSGRRVTVREWY